MSWSSYASEVVMGRPASVFVRDLLPEEAQRLRRILRTATTTTHASPNTKTAAKSHEPLPAERSAPPH
jgi:hypothetical protein